MFLRYEDVPLPVMARKDSVLVECEANSIEGGDTLNRPAASMTSTPHIVGSGCRGTIREVGAGGPIARRGHRVVSTFMSCHTPSCFSIPSIVTCPVPDCARHHSGRVLTRRVGNRRRLPLRVRPPHVGRDRLVLSSGRRGRGSPSRRIPPRNARGATGSRTASVAGPTRVSHARRFRSRHGINYSNDGRVDEVAIAHRRLVVNSCRRLGGRRSSAAASPVCLSAVVASPSDARSRSGASRRSLLGMNHQCAPGVFLDSSPLFSTRACTR